MSDASRTSLTAAPARIAHAAPLPPPSPLRSQWRDVLLSDFVDVFSVELLGLAFCLFFRVYRVMLSSYNTNFPTLLSFWDNDSLYPTLMLLHTLVTLILYIVVIKGAHRMGSVRYTRGETHGVTEAHEPPREQAPRPPPPSIFAALSGVMGGFGGQRSW